MPRPLPLATRRLAGLLCMVSGGLLAAGLLLKVYVGVYAWSTSGYQNPLALLLSFNLLGLLASGLLVRYGLRLRRGGDPPGGPNPNEML